MYTKTDRQTSALSESYFPLQKKIVLFAISLLRLLIMTYLLPVRATYQVMELFSAITLLSSYLECKGKFIV